jgi:hypothetical protein
MHRLRFVLVGWLVSILALTAAACGDDDGDPPVPLSPSPSPAGTTTPATSPPATATTTPLTPTPSATPTPPPSAAEQAQAIAVQFVGGTIRPGGEPCAGPGNPQARPCVGPQQVPDPERGIAIFGIEFPAGGATNLVLGRKADSTWAPWYATQGTDHHLKVLPGEMLVCADGDGLNVRERPDAAAPVVATLSDLDRVTADLFQLERAATSLQDFSAFYSGWYRLSAPVAGWASANFLADALDGDCRERDAWWSQRPR